MRAKRRVISIAVVLLLGGTIWHASLYVPTGPAEGVSVKGNTIRAASDRRTIRVGTFNIHGCKGRDDRRDVDRTAECLHGLDFVALNEVQGPWFWQRRDQAQRLGLMLGSNWLFAPAGRKWYHFETGNGLLTTLPVPFWQRIPLFCKYDRGYRNVVLVGLEHRGRTIHVLITHLTRRDDRERQAQLRAVIALFLALAEPAILMGDLNTQGDDRQIRCLLQTAGVTDPVEDVLGPRARQRIDWIVTRGLRAVDADIVATDASDHPMVWAELE